MADDSRRVERYLSFISLYPYLGIAAWGEMAARCGEPFRRQDRFAHLEAAIASQRSPIAYGIA